jgi:glutathione-regulated potassium-efflux system ancillary protein KefC
VQLVERELFESSLRSARSVMELLGAMPNVARQNTMRFRLHNIALFEEMYPHRDRDKAIAVAKRGRQQLEDQMAREREQKAQRRPRGWDPSADGSSPP